MGKAIEENKEKWQLSDWFVEATALLIQKVKHIENNENINIKGSKVMLNACVNVLRNVGHSHLSNWLEKQFEQTPFGYENTNSHQKDFAPKVEPKFHEGDWIVWRNQCYNVNYTGCGYELIDQNGLSISLIYTTIDENAHLWTIKDAKDGDVLVTGDWVFIFEKLNTNDKPVCYCHYDVELGFSIDVNTYISTGSYIRPATKEERDTLMKAMADAGYSFDFEKKELKWIEQNPVEWTAEDEHNLNAALSYIDDEYLRRWFKDTIRELTPT